MRGTVGDTSDSPLRDMHDPREHFRRLFGDVQTGLIDHIRALGNSVEAVYKEHSPAQHQEIIINAQKATQALAMFVATSVSEANRIGVAEGREERDISEAIYRGALELLQPDYLDEAPGPYGRDLARRSAIEEARIIWDETRRSVLESQALARAKQRGETEALVDEFVKSVTAAT